MNGVCVCVYARAASKARGLDDICVSVCALCVFVCLCARACAQLPKHEGWMTMIPDVKALGFSLDDERLQHNRTFQRRETQGATVYLYREKERDSERER